MSFNHTILALCAMYIFLMKKLTLNRLKVELAFQVLFNLLPFYKFNIPSNLFFILLLR